MERPETRYVAVGDADVAYQVIGEGPKDLLFFYGLGSHIDLFWDNPVASRFIQRLASFCRMIIFDRRGTGASDSFARSAIPTWEEWTDDVLAVLDAAGSHQAAIFATIVNLLGMSMMLFRWFIFQGNIQKRVCLLYTSPSPRD